MKKYIAIGFLLLIGLLLCIWIPVHSDTIVHGASSRGPLQLGTQCSFSFAAADTTKTCTLGSEFLDTELSSLKLVMPNFAATNPTATLSVKDAAGTTVYSQSGIAKATATYIPLSRPLTYGSSYVILLTTTAGTGGGSATVDSWIYK